MGARLESGITDYLREIKHFELLTPEEEQELGQRIRAARDCELRFAQGEITLDERETILREAAFARDRMIQANLRLVISVAKHFRNRGLPMEDLVNEGNVGLVNAVDRFDPEVGSRFSTYAGYWIDQAIRRAVQSAQQIIHIPSYLMEHIGGMRIALRELEEEHGRQPTLEELADHMGISPRKAKAIAHAIRSCTSRGSTSADGDDALAESIPDTRTPQPHDAILSASDTDFVTQMLARISDREAVVLKLRYGLNGGGKRLTLKQIGETVGLTRERVRQIEKEAKRKLEEYVERYL